MDLVEALSADDRVPAYLELEQDPVFPHLEAADRLVYVEHSLEIGRTQACAFAGGNVFEAAASLGARVVVADRDNRIAGITIRAEHDTQTWQITLYKPSLVEVHGLLAKVLPEPWDLDRVMALHVAHELFHHLEATRITPVHEQLPAVATFRLGRLWTTRTRARRCREIAAHAFAKELLGLPFLPNAVDWLLLVGMARWSAGELQDALSRARAAIAIAPPLR